MLRGVALWEVIQSLTLLTIEWRLKELHFPFCHGRSEKVPTVRYKLSLDTDVVDTLTLDVPGSRTVSSKFPLLTNYLAPYCNSLRSSDTQ